jgi:uncharacterized membrane protein YGL010W
MENQGGTKKIDALLAEYGESHQNAVNKKIHWICVPIIFFSLYGLIRVIPVPDVMTQIHPALSWASIILIASLFYYFVLSRPLFLGFILWAAVVFFGNEYLYQSLGGNSGWLALVLFALAWTGQFKGHQIEGKKPSFLKDIQFLLIGPAWLMYFIIKKT